MTVFPGANMVYTCCGLICSILKKICTQEIQYIAEKWQWQKQWQFSATTATATATATFQPKNIFQLNAE
jgi:hypothetical protein